MRTQTREWCAPITDTDYFIHSIWTLKSVSSEFAIFIALDQTVHMHMKFMKLLQYYSNKSDSWDSWRRCRVISGNFRDVLLNSVGLSKFLFRGRGRCSKCIYDSIFDCEIRSNWFTSFKLSRCRIFMKLIVGSAWRKPTGISATARSNKKCLCFILRWFSIVTVTFFFFFFQHFFSLPRYRSCLFYWRSQEVTASNWSLFESGKIVLPWGFDGFLLFESFDIWSMGFQCVDTSFGIFKIICDSFDTRLWLAQFMLALSKALGDICASLVSWLSWLDTRVFNSYWDFIWI